MKSRTLITLLILCQYFNINSTNDRSKRTLIWRKGASRIQVITGFGIPVDLKQETVIVGTVFKANYYLPSNVSQLRNPYTFYARKKRSSASRWDIYNLLSNAMEMRGLNGKECILRAICEMAHTPLLQNYGLFHEITQMVLRPSSTKEILRKYSDNEYLAAEKFGSRNSNCGSVFKACHWNPLDMFTFFS